ncbi:MAG: hypothetical protein RLN81_07945 [Balneolaceae bacterium]
MNKKLISQILNENKQSDIELKKGDLQIIKLPRIPFIKDTEFIDFHIYFENDPIISKKNLDDTDGLSLPRAIQIQAIDKGISKLKIQPLDAITKEKIKGIDQYEVKITITD